MLEGRAGIRATRHDFHVVRGQRRREKGLISRGASLGIEEGPKTKRQTEEGSCREMWGKRLLLVVVVIVELVVAVLDSRRDLLRLLSRLPPTRMTARL